LLHCVRNDGTKADVVRNCQSCEITTSEVCVFEVRFPPLREWRLELTASLYKDNSTNQPLRHSCVAQRKQESIFILS